MKKFLFAVFLLTLSVFSLSACDASEEETLPALDPATVQADFSEYLDRENFVTSFSIGDNCVFKNYKYEGKVFSDLVKGPVWEGIFKDGPCDGCEAEEMLFGYRYMFGSASDERKSEEYFYTRTPLEGFNLPFDAVFDEKLESVLAKIGIPADSYRDFLAEESRMKCVTIFESETASLVLQKNVTLPQGRYRSEYAYALIFTEINAAAKSSHGIRTVTRMLTLAFTKEHTLGCFEVEVDDHDRASENLR